jgi:DNA-binding MarR family transcriptional regulator
VTVTTRHEEKDGGQRRARAREAAPHPSTPRSGERDEATGRLVQLLSEIVLALYDSAPHTTAACRHTEGEPLTTRQMEAVVFLSHHRSATMGELADGLGISAAAASELVARLGEKGVVTRRRDAEDARVVRVALAASAERHAEELLARWGAHVEAVFAAYPGIDPGTLAAFLRALIDSLKGRSPA